MSPVEYGDISAKRGIFLTVMAILFVVLALSDFTKVFQHSAQPEVSGMVVLGHKFGSSLANITFGVLMGLFLLAYAYGIWHMRAWVVPIAVLYAFYVPSNQILFWSLHQLRPPTISFITFILFVALTGSIGTALYLAFVKDRLR